MSEPMKILHLTWSGDLAGMLWDIVQTQYKDPELDLHVCFGTRGKGMFHDKMQDLGINPFVLGMKRKYGPISNLLGAWRLRQMLKTNSYDIIHLQEAILPFPFWIATSRGTHKGVILHNRGEFNFTGGGLAALGQWMKKMAYRIMVGGRIDRLVCNSKYSMTKTPILRQYAHKFIVLHNAIDMSTVESIANKRASLRSALRAELNLSADDCILIVAARLVAFKRIDRFIRAFCMAIQEGMLAHAIIVGDGSSRSKLQSLALHLSGGDRIHFLGFRNDAKEIIAGADLFVLPSSGEAFGNVAIEALSLDIPLVVFSDVGGPLEFVEEGENGFVAADEPSLAKILLTFTEGKQLRHGFRMHALIDHKQFEIEGYVKRIKEIYREILHTQPSV